MNECKISLLRFGILVIGVSGPSCNRFQILKPTKGISLVLFKTYRLIILYIC